MNKNCVLSLAVSNITMTLSVTAVNKELLPDDRMSSPRARGRGRRSCSPAASRAGRPASPPGCSRELGSESIRGQYFLRLANQRPVLLVKGEDSEHKKAGERGLDHLPLVRGGQPPPVSVLSGHSSLLQRPDQRTRVCHNTPW